MGSEKTTTNTNSTQQAQYTPTAEETALNKLNLEQVQAAQSGTLANQQSALSLQGKLLQGAALPGYLNTLPGGVDTNAQNSMAQQAMNLTKSNFNGGGILDSGTAASGMARSAADSYNSNAQFNVSNLLQLMNLASGQSAGVVNGISNTSSQLSQSLAGLRSYNGTANGSSTTLGMNPFLKSFEQSAGKTLGSPSYSQTKGFGF